MKPIKLKIKGVNSFLEEQTIDFLKLTKSGLFGIFGPTGGGKSTVLDAMTLALYGEVGRGSTDFINTNAEKGRAEVIYIFQISDAYNKIYEITRSWKRKKDGKINSDKCRLTDITNQDNPIVLADKKTSADKEILRILGLSFDDFTRTVVLPQGKFSEFLKLGGKERRDMLERLFNLSKYGENISIKLSSKIKECNSKQDELNGRLKGFEDISEDRLQLKEEELELQKKEQEKILKELKILEECDKENEEVWNLTKEKEQHIKTREQLLERETEIKDEKEKIKKAENAAKVYPYITVFEENKKELDKNEEELKNLKENFDVLEKEYKKSEQNWNETKTEYENKIPELNSTREKIKECIEIKKKINELSENIKTNENRYKEKEKQKNIFLDELRKTEKELEEVLENIKSNKEKSEKIIIDYEVKSKISEGSILELSIKEALKELEKDKNEVIKLENENKEICSLGIKARDNKNLKENEKNKLESQIKKLEENPLNNEDMAAEGQKIEILRQKHNELQKVKEEISGLENNINVIQKKYEEETKKLPDADKKINKIEEELNEFIIANMAHKLRKELKDGCMCPVCRTVYHEDKEALAEAGLDMAGNAEYDNEVDFNEKKAEIEERKKNAEKEKEEIRVRLIQHETQLNQWQSDYKNKTACIKETEEIFKIKTFEEYEAEFNNKNKKINEIKELIKSQNKNLEKINKEYEDAVRHHTQFQTEYKTRKNAIISADNKISLKDKELKAKEEQLNFLKSETKVENFAETFKEIERKEREKDVLRKTAEKLNDEKEKKTAFKEKINNNILETDKNIEVLKTNINKDAESLKEREESLNEKAGKYSENLEESLNEIESSINLLDSRHKKAEEEKIRQEKQYNEISEKINICQGVNKNLKDKDKTAEKNLYENLKLQKFKSSSEVKEAYLMEEELDILKNKVKEYEEALIKAENSIENIKTKLHGRTLEHDCYIKIKNELAEKKKEKEDISGEIIKLQEEIKTLNEKILLMKNLLKERDKLNHREALLKELGSLFKGKKFVEYAAQSQLKYISREASKKLRAITNDRYEIEVDSDGKFIMRDNASGGILRDPSSLSGGETFLASLALALALSSQIQLKSTAPLELFFLDEGFGTLDDNLLDTVMKALEKIHHDKLKVGIISHVEAIKNRIPVKLIVTPAKPGEGGTKVKIEKS